MIYVSEEYQKSALKLIGKILDKSGGHRCAHEPSLAGSPTVPDADFFAQMYKDLILGIWPSKEVPYKMYADLLAALVYYRTHNDACADHLQDGLVDDLQLFKKLNSEYPKQISKYKKFKNFTP